MSVTIDIRAGTEKWFLFALDGSFGRVYDSNNEFEETETEEHPHPLAEACLRFFCVFLKEDIVMMDGLTPLQKQRLKLWTETKAWLALGLGFSTADESAQIGTRPVKDSVLFAGEYRSLMVPDPLNSGKSRPIMWRPSTTLAELTDQLVGTRPKNEVYRPLTIRPNESYRGAKTRLQARSPVLA